MASVYVAGASAELARCKAFMAALTARGHLVTSRWPAVIERVGAANEGVGPDIAYQAALDNLYDIGRARLLVLLVPAAGVTSHGAFFELGFAKRSGLWTVAAGDAGRSVFCRLADYLAADDLEAQRHVDVWARGEEARQCAR